MKKTICVILTLLLSMAVLFTGCGDNVSTPGGVVDNTDAAGNPIFNENSNSNAQSDIKIEEGETTVEEHLGAEADLFISGKYYLEGVIYSEGEAMPVLLATDGTNVQLTANVNNISFGVLVMEEKTYAVLPKANQYTELSEMLIGALGLEDSLGVTDFQDIRDEESDDKATTSQYSVTINGDAGLCTVYTYDDTIVKLYSIGEKLIQVENFDLDGNMTMQIVVDEISEQIPSNQLTLKGLNEASVTEFIKSFMGSVSY